MPVRDGKHESTAPLNGSLRHSPEIRHLRVVAPRWNGRGRSCGFGGDPCRDWDRRTHVGPTVAPRTHQHRAWSAYRAINSIRSRAYQHGPASCSDDVRPHLQSACTDNVSARTHRRKMLRGRLFGEGKVKRW